VDESLLTGESLPVSKQAGDSVFGGAYCLNGSLVVELLAVGEKALAGEIQRLVAEAASSKAPIQSLADRIAAVVVPIVLGIALVTFLTWSFLGSDASYAKGIEFAISVLIIACPCALGLATPVAVIASIGRAAQFGILIKSGEALQTLASVQTIALDKTGTVTVGRPDLARIVPVGLTDAELLMYAAGAEAGSRHPFAVAVLQHFTAPLPETRDFSEEPGRGICAIVAGRKVEVARPDQSSPDLPQLAPNETCVQVWIDESPAGFLVFSDAVREDSALAIRRLRAMGVEPVMLTGDSESVAREIAAQLGISHFRARLTPQQKAEAIRSSEGGVTAFVGDGINDAAALAAADVGMAMGAGAEAARAAASVALLRNSLTAAVDALALGRASLRVIKQNLFWAFGYNLILIPTAAGAFYGLLGWKLTPMIAAAAMACSSLTVVLNALRLKAWKPPS
jgi:Cu+-exporting ATPase